MLSLSNVSAKMAGNYYGKDDYYIRDKNKFDRWQGKLCKDLSLEEGQPINAEQFTNLLSQNPKRAGYDLTFSAPKSVSVAAAISDEIRQDMVDCHNAAVSDILQQIEQNEIAARVTKDGVTEMIKTGNMACARFQHYVSRNHDPQLHDHCVILNKTKYNDRIYAVSNENLYINKILYGQLYRNQLARNLQAKGYAVDMTDPEKGFFELAGVDKETLETFSTRRQEILAKLKEWQASDTETVSKACIATRKAKENKDLGELQASWRETIQEMGGVDITKVAKPIQHNQAEQAEAFGRAVERLAEKQFAFSERELERAVLAEGVATGINREEFKAILLKSRIPTLGETVHKNAIVSLGTPKDGQDMVYYTTKRNQAVESQIEQLTTKSKSLISPIFAAKTKKALKELNMSLSAEQTQAVIHITSNKHHFCAVQGLAGTGKTYMLAAARQVWEKNGFNVIGASFTGNAAEGLQTDAQIQSSTIHSLLNRLEKEAGNANPDEDMAAKKEWNFEGLEPGETRDVWVIDEAGMISNDLLLPLLQAAIAKKAQVVFVGDYQQLAPVGAGNAYSNMVQTGKMSTCYLTDIQRQKESEQLLQAVKEAVTGDINKSLELVADSTQEISSAAKRFKAIAAEYTGLPAAEQAKTIVLTAGNKDRTALNETIRKELVKSGQLEQGTELQIQGVKDIDTVSRHFATGDKIIFLKNNYRKLNVRNGQTARIKSIDGTHITVETAGRELTFDSMQYKYFDHGYAVTVHKAQGVTEDRAIINIDSTQRALNNRNSYYVDISRARHKVSIYTDSKAKMTEQVTEFAKKVSSADFDIKTSRLSKLFAGRQGIKLPAVKLPSIKMPIPALDIISAIAAAPIKATAKLIESIAKDEQQETHRRGMRR